MSELVSGSSEGVEYPTLGKYLLSWSPFRSSVSNTLHTGSLFLPVRLLGLGSRTPGDTGTK